MRNSNEIQPRSGDEIFRPYARLISILGDQLITSKWVGVIELVKNCYDADANNVTVRFLNFDELGQSPVIEIEDDGDGMTLDTILNVWMKPATPNKINKKKSKELRRTPKGRLMQGDKGIGRFAIYKLGNFVEVYTKTKSTDEVKLSLNFREYAQNDEFAEEDNVPEKFLDEIRNEWQLNDSPEIIKNDKGQGTLIRISDLRSDWKYIDLQKLQVAFQRMIPPVIPAFQDKITRDFDIKLYWNKYEFPPATTVTFEKVIELAPFSFAGSIDETGTLRFTYNHREKEVKKTIDLFDSEEQKAHDLWNIKLFKTQFLSPSKEKERNSPIAVQKKSGDRHLVQKKAPLEVRKPDVGPCFFYFYAFDWKDKGELDAVQEIFIKDNSVYLYRDFTRVYPYGEKEYDWLMLSKGRAEDRAGHYFSYNDLIGFIFITQEHNPKLRDQASREGLVNIDGASHDFIAMIQAALKVMKDYVAIDKHKRGLEKDKVTSTFDQKFNDAFRQLVARLETIKDEKALLRAKNFFKSTNLLLDQYRKKVSITEELAGLGMAVEKSSHDVFMLISKMIQNANDLVKRFEKGKLLPATLQQFFADLIENLEFIYEELQIFQPLLREHRKVNKDISVRSAIERVERYYRRDLLHIGFKVTGDDVVVKTNLGLLLQVFLNLLDNSIYWLNQGNTTKRQIEIRIDSLNRQIILADSGGGIIEDAEEIIFLEFYSTKSEGRGLGLYIVRELLQRINASISLITTDEIKILPGANFLIQFHEDN